MSYHLMSSSINPIDYPSINNCDRKEILNSTALLDMFTKSAWSYCRQNDIFIPSLEQLWDEFLCCVEEHIEDIRDDGYSGKDVQIYKAALQSYELQQVIDSLNRHKLTYRIGPDVFNDPQISLFT